MMLKKCLWLTLAGALFLQGCDSNDGILDDDSDTRNLSPKRPEQVDPSIPNPPSDVAVITAKDGTITDVAGNEVLLRGANLLYAEDPSSRLASIAAIKSTGSNTVRILLTKSTTTDQLRSVMDAVVENQLIGLLSFTGPSGEIACTDRTTAINSAVKDLWLNEWMTVLSESKYQPYMMINIANQWGPADIFSESEKHSYAEYIDKYREYIARFRDIGFKVPLVIDAPGCGADYAAFLGGRDLELLAADSEKNLVLSVHMFGEQWDSNRELLRNMGRMQKLAAPVIVSELGGLPESETDAVDTESVMKMAMGDMALRLNLNWSNSAEVASLVYPLGETRDGAQTQVTMQAYIPQSYFDEKEHSVGIQAVLMNENGEYGLLAPKWTSALYPNRWNYLIFNATGIGSIVESSENFDLSALSHVGLRLLVKTNELAEAIDLSGDIWIDNFRYSAKADPNFVDYFDTPAGDWQYASWGAPGLNGASTQKIDGRLAINVNWPASSSGAVAQSNKIRSVSQQLDLSTPFTFTVDIFVPQEYSSETNLVIQPFLLDDKYIFGTFASIPFRAPEYAFDEWNTITVNMGDFQARVLSDGWDGNDNIDVTSAPQAVGIQISGVTALKSEPILLDNYRLENDDNVSIGFSAIYTAAFENWTFGWGTGDADALSIDADGTLSVLPEWADSGSNQSIAFMHGGLPSSNTFIDLSETFHLSVDVFVPEEYSGETGMAIQPFFLDSANGEFGTFGWYRVGIEVPVGEWHTIEKTFTDFATEMPNWNSESLTITGFVQGLGLEVAQVKNAKSEPVLFKNYHIDRLVEAENTVVFVEFDTEQQVDSFSWTQDDSDLFSNSWDISSVKKHDYSVKPFSWLGWGWSGVDDYNLVSKDGFTLDGNPSSGVDLTDRGETMVNGEFGIAPTSVEAGFTP